jgi:hypothetical protein
MRSVIYLGLRHGFLRDLLSFTNTSSLEKEETRRVASGNGRKCKVGYESYTHNLITFVTLTTILDMTNWKAQRRANRKLRRKPEPATLV